jgi:hypothetical protein
MRVVSVAVVQATRRTMPEECSQAGGTITGHPGSGAPLEFRRTRHRPITRTALFDGGRKSCVISASPAA